MALVADLSGNTVSNLQGSRGGLDRPLSTPNRNNAGSPMSSLTPAYAGEIITDTVNNMNWIAAGTTNTDWAPVIVAI